MRMFGICLSLTSGTARLISGISDLSLCVTSAVNLFLQGPTLSSQGFDETVPGLKASDAGVGKH